MTTSRIQELESLDFEWDSLGAAWEARSSDLADYHKVHGHCNVPLGCSENTKLANWVSNQKQQYRLHRDGKPSRMTTFRIQALEGLGFEWDSLGAAWGARLSELADFRKMHGHCNVPYNHSENSKLAYWVFNQRQQYRLHRDGKPSLTTTFRIQALEGLGFEWDSHSAAWEDRLSDLADYLKVHGHCNVPLGCSENTKLANWVSNQRQQYRLHREGKRSPITLPRIQGLENLGFEWGSIGAAWEACLSDLADYRKVHGHCNVPLGCSENTKLANWVSKQREQYRLHRDGKPSRMTTFRIQGLENLGFEWGSIGAAWEARLSELADYRKINGHCNVPKKFYIENFKLANWVSDQRTNYRWHAEGKTSSMTPFRIQELESLGFEWDSLAAVWENRLSELTDYHKIHGHCNVPRIYSENTKLGTWVKTQREQYRLHLDEKTSHLTTLRIQELESLGFVWNARGAAWEDRLSELTDYHKFHGHCNVPQIYPENAKLGSWVKKQKTQYRLHVKGKKSLIQALKNVGFSELLSWTAHVQAMRLITTTRNSCHFESTSSSVSMASCQAGRRRGDSSHRSLLPTIRSSWFKLP